MRVTFVLPHLNLSGGVRVVAIYARLLQQRGHKVAIVSTRREQYSLKAKMKILVKSGRWPGMLPDSPHSHMDSLDVNKIIVDHSGPIRAKDLPDADVVVATWWETAEWLDGLPRSKGAPVYFIQHHEVFDYLPVKRVKATYRMPLHKITISSWLVNLMRDTYNDSVVDMVHNSVDTEQFHAEPREKKTLPTVGMMYSAVPFKGCEVSLAAIAKVHDRIGPIKLVTFGDGEVSPRLALPKYASHVQKPAQDKIKDLYASCDVWLCGSWAEGFHLPPLEAMACRCPVVSTRVGGPMDIIKDGINGYLVNIGDSLALADRLADVLTLNSMQWRAMSEAAFATAAQYSWEDATKLFETSLENAIIRMNKGEIGWNG